MVRSGIKTHTGKIWNKLKEQGKYHGGLDGDYPELRDVSKEYKRKLNELFEEYGLGKIDFK